MPVNNNSSATFRFPAAELEEPDASPISGAIGRWDSADLRCSKPDAFAVDASQTADFDALFDGGVADAQPNATTRSMAEWIFDNKQSGLDYWEGVKNNGSALGSIAGTLGGIGVDASYTAAAGVGAVYAAVTDGGFRRYAGDNLSPVARDYWDTHSAGEIAVDAGVLAGASLWLGGAVGPLRSVGARQVDALRNGMTWLNNALNFAAPRARSQPAPVGAEASGGASVPEAAPAATPPGPLPTGGSGVRAAVRNGLEWATAVYDLASGPLGQVDSVTKEAGLALAAYYVAQGEYEIYRNNDLAILPFNGPPGSESWSVVVPDTGFNASCWAIGPNTRSFYTRPFIDEAPFGNDPQMPTAKIGKSSLNPDAGKLASLILPASASGGQVACGIQWFGNNDIASRTLTSVSAGRLALDLRIDGAVDLTRLMGSITTSFTPLRPSVGDGWYAGPVGLFTRDIETTPLLRITTDNLDPNKLRASWHDGHIGWGGSVVRTAGTQLKLNPSFGQPTVSEVPDGGTRIYPASTGTQ